MAQSNKSHAEGTATKKREIGQPTLIEGGSMLGSEGAAGPWGSTVFGWKTSKQAIYCTRKASARTIVDNAMAKWEAAQEAA